jgi:Plasmid pRiA4b ORF-3-like protein
VAYAPCVTNGRAYVFRAELVGHPGVVRTIALSEDLTLEVLHELLRTSFGWSDPHLYSFWLSGAFWDGHETEYTAPFEVEETGAKSAATPVGALALEEGQTIAYLFDYGDEWRVEIVVTEIRPAGEEPYPQILQSEGEAPPQYEQLDEGEE